MRKITGGKYIVLIPEPGEAMYHQPLKKKDRAEIRRAAVAAKRRRKAK